MSFNRENHSSVSTRINDLAAMICRLTGSHSEISHAPERLGDVKHSLASIGKLRATGYDRPITPLAGAVQDYVTRYLVPDRRLGDEIPE